MVNSATLVVNALAYYVLTVDSTPMKVQFKLGTATNQTPYSQQIYEGTYVVAMPKTVDVEGETYTFQRWNDNSTNPSKTVNLTADTTLIATYGIGELPFDWWQWLIDNWYIPAGAGMAILVLIALWPRQPPVIVLQPRKGKRLKHLSAQAT